MQKDLDKAIGILWVLRVKKREKKKDLLMKAQKLYNEKEMVFLAFLRVKYFYYDNMKEQDRSSHQRCSVKKGVLKNFAKFTGKHMCQSLFFNKVAGLIPQIY